MVIFTDQLGEHSLLRVDGQTFLLGCNLLHGDVSLDIGEENVADAAKQSVSRVLIDRILLDKHLGLLAQVDTLELLLDEDALQEVLREELEDLAHA